MIDAEIGWISAKIDRGRMEERMLIIRDGAHFTILIVDGKDFRVEASSQCSMHKDWVVRAGVEFRWDGDKSCLVTGITSATQDLRIEQWIAQ
jgi:hypothetical protein